MSNEDSKKILIVENEEGIRESLKLILSDQYDLILTDSGEEALQCLDNDPTIGLVLLNSKASAISVPEILKQIKNRRCGLNTLMIADHKSVETAVEAAQLGAAGHIVKPFKSDEILETVRKNLN